MMKQVFRRMIAGASALFTAAVLLAGPGLSLPVRAMSGDGAVLTAGALSQEIELPSYDNIAVIASEDYCSAELAALFDASFEQYTFSNLIEQGSPLSAKTAPDAVFILTNYSDTVTVEEGKAPKYMGSMKMRTIIRNVRDGAGEDVPVGWVMIADTAKRESLAAQFRSLQDTEDSPATHDFYTSYTYYDSEGGAAERADLAKRIAGPLKGDGMFVSDMTPEDETAYIDYHYYFSEFGDDKTGTALTPDSPKKTISAYFSTYYNSHGKQAPVLPDNARVIIECTGKINVGKTQNVLGMSYNTCPKRADGSLVPVICRTYRYDGTNRADLYTTYEPHDSGSSRMVITYPLTMKDVQMSSRRTSADLNCEYLWIIRTDVVFDNCTFACENGDLWKISASNNTYDANRYTVEEDERIEVNLTFRNGFYGRETGVEYVSGMNSSSLWRNAESGGSILEALNQYSTLTVEAGAKIETLYGVSNTLKYGGVTVNILPGGEVGVLAVTNRHKKNQDYDAPLVINMEGRCTGEIHGPLGYTTLLSDYELNIQNAKFIGTPVSDFYSNTDFLGSEDAVITGSARIKVENSLFLTFAGLNKESGMHFGGQGAITDGEDIEILVRESLFSILPNDKLTSVTASIAFGGSCSTLITEHRVTIESGLFDMSEMEEEYVTFGSEDGSSRIYQSKLVIGTADGPAPVFLGNVYIGGYPAWYGRLLKEGKPEVNKTERLNVTIFNMVVTGDFYLNPVSLIGEVEFDPETGEISYQPTTEAPETDSWQPDVKDDEDEENAAEGEIWSGVNGSVNAVIHNGVFEGRTYLANGTVYGDLQVRVLGGTFRDLYDGADSRSILGERTVEYEKAQYELLNGEEVRTDDPEESTGSEDGVPGTGFSLQSLILPLSIGGAVLVILAVVLILLFAKKKKAGAGKKE